MFKNISDPFSAPPFKVAGSGVWISWEKRYISTTTLLAMFFQSTVVLFKLFLTGLSFRVQQERFSHYGVPEGD
jgi:hypothetical protein